MYPQSKDASVTLSTPGVSDPGAVPLRPSEDEGAGAVPAWGTTITDRHLERGATLVVAPHGDDELLGCGGWLLRSAGRARRAVVFVTGREVVRHEESVRALEGLDVEVYDLSLPEGKSWSREQRTAAVRTLAGLRDALDPAYLLVPNPADPHPDHRRCHELVRRALTGSAPAELQVLRYEGLVPLAGANWWLDVSDQLDEKLRRLALYRSQEARYRLCAIARNLNTYRGGTLLRRGVTAAEAFHRTGVREYLA